MTLAKKTDYGEIFTLTDIWQQQDHSNKERRSECGNSGTTEVVKKHPRITETENSTTYFSTVLTLSASNRENDVGHDTMNREKNTNSRSIGDNESFVALIQVAGDDPVMRQRLTAILRLPEFQRQSLLGSAVSELRLHGAPQEFIAAMEALRDDAVAQKALQVLAKTN